MIEYNKIEEWISSDNTKKIQYVILFFIFMMALSNHVFDYLFGCSLKKLTKNIYVRHCVSFLFLYLLMDVNIDKTENMINPLLSFVLSAFIYALALILLHSHQLYIGFIICIVFFLILLDKYKVYLEQSVQDQELKQDHLDMIYKTNNVFIILMVLSIVIGSLSSFDAMSFRKTFSEPNKTFKTCEKI